MRLSLPSLGMLLQTCSGSYFKDDLNNYPKGTISSLKTNLKEIRIRLAIEISDKIPILMSELWSSMDTLSTRKGRWCTYYCCHFVRQMNGEKVRIQGDKKQTNNKNLIKPGYARKANNQRISLDDTTKHIEY